MLNVYSLDVASNPPLKIAYHDAMDCIGNNPAAADLALWMAKSAARRVESLGKQDSRSVLLAIRDVVRWLGPRPGRKNLILVSPGFIVSRDMLQNEDNVIDQAIRAQVSISTLDAGGIFTLFPSVDTAYRGSSRDRIMEKEALMRQDATASGEIMQELAEATGGTTVRNTNDLFAGLQKLASPPEYTYVLGFKPQSKKHDATLHPLEVKLTKGKKLTVLARRGYYAPKQ